MHKGTVTLPSGAGPGARYTGAQRLVADVDAGFAAAWDAMPVARGSRPTSTTDQATRSWSTDDRWWRIGNGLAALARTADGPARTLREVILLDGASVDEVSIDRVAGALATQLDSDVTVPVDGASVLVHRSRRPWPAAWRPDSTT